MRFERILRGYGVVRSVHHWRAWVQRVNGSALTRLGALEELWGELAAQLIQLLPGHTNRSPLGCVPRCQVEKHTVYHALALVLIARAIKGVLRARISHLKSKGSDTDKKQLLQITTATIPQQRNRIQHTQRSTTRKQQR